MATRKEYEMLFLLKAQIDSAFGTGFTTARGYVSSLEAEIKGYNSTLSDISAYQKTAQSLSTLEAKVAQAGTTSAREAQKIADYKQKLKDIEAELQKAGVDTSRLTDEQKRLNDEIARIRAEAEAFAEMQNRITEVANAFAVMKPIADTAFNAVVRLDEAIYSSIESAAELEYTMSGVKATSGATAEETAELTKLAKDLGAATSYTASEVSTALQTQALAGWSVEEMLSGMPAVVNLAAASQEDLNTMTGIVSDSLNAFGLHGSEAVNRFADTLVKTATSSNTTVSMLGESLSYVESSAANLGYSIEDVGIMLGIMANNALKGSVSGSALNTALTRMSGANENAAAEMDKLDLSMFKADGTAKSLLQFMNELRDAFSESGMTAQEMQISAYKLAGQRGMRGLLSVVNTSQEEWEEMTEDIYSAAGAANEMSDIRLDNFRGQMYLLESAADAFKTTIGEAFIPTATGAAEILTDVTTAANDFAGGMGEALVPISAGITTFGAAAGAIGSIGTGLQFAKFALDSFVPEWTAMMISSAEFALIPAAIVGVTTAIAIAGRQMYDATDFSKSSDQLEEYSKAWGDTRDAISESIESGDIQKQKDLLGDAEEAVRVSTGNVVDLINKANDAQATLQESGDNADWLIAQNWKDQLADAEEELEKNRAARDALKKSIDENAEAQMEHLQITKLTTDQYEEIVELADAYGTAWDKAYAKVYESLEKQFNLLGKVEEMEKTSLSTVQSNLDKKQNQWEDYEKNLKTIFEGGIDVTPLLNDLGAGTAEAMSFAQAVADDIKNNGGKAVQKIADETASVQSTVSDIAGVLADMQPQVEEAKNALEDALQLNDEKLKNEAYLAAANVLVGYEEGLADTSGAEQALQDLGDISISSLMESLGEHSPSVYANDAGVNVVVGFENGVVSLKESAYNTMYSFGTYAMQGAISGINAKKSELRNAVQSAISISNSARTATISTGRGYASGTAYATPGLHMTGENGPEIIDFSGGERVYNAAQTRQIMDAPRIQSGESSKVISVSFAPTITINGNGNEAAIRQGLGAYNQELMQMIENCISEREDAMSRRGY